MGIIRRAILSRLGSRSGWLTFQFSLCISLKVPNQCKVVFFANCSKYVCVYGYVEYGFLLKFSFVYNAMYSVLNESKMLRISR
jgi:hypothetical protein